MPEGGTLSIETQNCRLEAGPDGIPDEPAAGDYAMVLVRDTGTGMRREVMEKAFEPFFTTKGVGEGTGLGLSQVYGFIKQSDGHVTLESELGRGTSVRIYLPRHHPMPGEQPQPSAPPSRGAALSAPPRPADELTVLLVEDDEDVRLHGAELLGDLGYRVVTAADGASGLRLLESEPRVQLLFTDIGLPGPLDGREFAAEAKRRRPGLKILLTTGYARDAALRDARVDPEIELIAKPFTFHALAE